MQLSWTNPFTNRLLFDAGLTVVLTHQDQTKSREFTNPRTIPRICEVGPTVGRDAVSRARRTHRCRTTGRSAPRPPAPATSSRRWTRARSTTAFPGVDAEHAGQRRHVPQPRQRVVHHRLAQREGRVRGRLLLGEDPQRSQRIRASTTTTTRRRTTGTWNATTRTGNCLLAPATDPYACGNMSLYYPEDPTNRDLLPSEAGRRSDMNTGVRSADERVWFGALYCRTSGRSTGSR